MKKELTRPVGMIPSGLFIAGVNQSGRPEGFLASWVQQTSFTPLIISLAVGNDKPILRTMKKSGMFTLNILAKSNAEIMKNFWKPMPAGTSPFDDLALELSEYGPILTASVAAMECRIVNSATPGDHTLLFGEVVKTHLFHGDESPSVHIRKFGNSY